MEKNYKLDHKIKVKSDDLIWHVHEYGIDLASSHIYLMGNENYIVGAGSEFTNEPGVEFTMANRFIKNLNLCMRTTNKEIVIHMKTCGGDYNEGMAIYDSIKSCPTPITIINYTHARSMSSIIMQAANKRVMMPNSHFMFHYGSLELSGTDKKVRSEVRFMEAWNNVMIDIYAKQMKERGKFSHKPLTHIVRWIKDRMDREEDVFLTAQQAVDYGLADEIFNYDWSLLTKYTQEQLSR